MLPMASLPRSHLAQLGWAAVPRALCVCVRGKEEQGKYLGCVWRSSCTVFRFLLPSPSCAVSSRTARSCCEWTRSWCPWR